MLELQRYGRSSQAVLLGDEAADIWYAKLPQAQRLTKQESHMMDLFYVGMMIAFFAISVLYVYACGKL